MISVSQVNGSAESTITCLGKYQNQDGKKITIKDTFTFKGSLQNKLNSNPLNCCKVADNNNVHWTNWTAVSECFGVGGKDCGPGTQIQKRECRREQGGQLCQLNGREVEKRNGSCFLKPCPGKCITKNNL